MTVPPVDFKEHIVSRTFSISFHQKKAASNDQASNITITLSMKKKSQKIVIKVKKNSEVEERDSS